LSSLSFPLNARWKLVVLLLAFFFFGFCIGVYLGYTRGIPFVGRRAIWSIGIYKGSSPFNLAPYPGNPILTADDVTDVKARYVADPFMMRKNSTWYMFFEVFNDADGQGDIGLAISYDGVHWSYEGIVLDEPFHLSYPYVFRWKGRYYMIPETGDACTVKLYEATDFPKKWVHVKDLIYGCYRDPSIFYYDGIWWMYAYSEPGILHLFYSHNLTGPWIEHPESPIVKCNCNMARPAGRVIVFGERILRYAQDDSLRYGVQVRVFEIMKISPRKYEERELAESPILGPSGSGWNADGMHHIDLHRLDDGTWIACADGYRFSLVFGLEY